MGELGIPTKQKKYKYNIENKQINKYQYKRKHFMQTCRDNSFSCLNFDVKLNN